MILPFAFRINPPLLWLRLTPPLLSVQRPPMVNYILSTLICMIYHPPLRLTFGLLDLMLNHPDGRPYIMFLFVISTLCLTLPSDSASRQTPLPLANDSCQIGSFGTLTLSVYSMHGTHQKKPGAYAPGLFPVNECASLYYCELIV